MRPPKEAEKQLKAIADQYKAFSLKLPPSPGILYLQDQLAILKSREEHAQNLIAIEKRRLKETKAVRDLLTQTRNGLSCLSQTERQATIAGALEAKAKSAGSKPEDDECLGKVTFALMDFAALSARSDTSSRLALLRTSLEDRASALRLSAAGA